MSLLTLPSTFATAITVELSSTFKPAQVDTARVPIRTVLLTALVHCTIDTVITIMLFIKNPLFPDLFLLQSLWVSKFATLDHAQ
jgi:hypothetical protein